MNVQGVTTDAYLGISCTALGVQSWALAHLQANRDQLIRTGLRRTAMCRVAGATAYVYVGLNALWFHRSVIVTAFIVFALIQVMYMLNARADVALKRRLTTRNRGDAPMSAYAPQAIQQLFTVIQSRIPSAQLGGIVGDAAHS